MLENKNFLNSFIYRSATLHWFIFLVSVRSVKNFYILAVLGIRDILVRIRIPDTNFGVLGPNQVWPKWLLLIAGGI